MKKLGLIHAVVIGASLLSMPVLASAGNFKIVNNTNHELSFGIGRSCSADFGSIPSHSNHTVSDSDFRHACKSNKHHCLATVYTDDNCSGELIAQIELDTDMGLKGVLDSTDGYAFTWSTNSMMITESIK